MQTFELLWLLQYVDGRILMNQSCAGTGHCVHTAAGGWGRVRFPAPQCRSAVR